MNIQNINSINTFPHPDITNITHTKKNNILTFEYQNRTTYNIIPPKHTQHQHITGSSHHITSHTSQHLDISQSTYQTIIHNTTKQKQHHQLIPTSIHLKHHKHHHILTSQNTNNKTYTIIPPTHNKHQHINTSMNTQHHDLTTY